MGQMFSLSLVSIVCLLLYLKVSSGVFILPLEEAGEMMNSAALADFMSVARAANIPDDLLWNILDQAKTLYNHESSPFIQSSEVVPAKRGLELRMRKKMTSGIMGLTRPRFGKRPGRPVLGREGGPMVQLDKLFSQLTQPRFGKRN